LHTVRAPRGVTALPLAETHHTLWKGNWGERTFMFVRYTRKKPVLGTFTQGGGLNWGDFIAWRCCPTIVARAQGGVYNNQSGGGGEGSARGGESPSAVSGGGDARCC
jgi:hypothetical protein